MNLCLQQECFKSHQSLEKSDNRELQSTQALIKQRNQGYGIIKGTSSTWPENNILYSITSSLSSQCFVLLIVKAANKACEPTTIFSIRQRSLLQLLRSFICNSALLNTAIISAKTVSSINVGMNSSYGTPCTDNKCPLFLF